MVKEIKVEWCENFIKAKFKKLPTFSRGFREIKQKESEVYNEI